MEQGIGGDGIEELRRRQSGAWEEWYMEERCAAFANGGDKEKLPNNPYHTLVVDGDSILVAADQKIDIFGLVATVGAASAATEE